MSTASKLAEVFEKIGKRAKAEKIRVNWRRRALRGCWPDPESKLAHELHPIKPKTKFGTQGRCWSTSNTGSAFENFCEVCPLLKEVLHLGAELKKGRKPVAPKVSYTCCMAGYSPDAVRPAVTLHCQQTETTCAAEDGLASTPGWNDWSEANPMFLLLVVESAVKNLPDSPMRFHRNGRGGHRSVTRSPCHFNEQLACALFNSSSSSLHRNFFASVPCYGSRPFTAKRSTDWPWECCESYSLTFFLLVALSSTPDATQSTRILEQAARESVANRHVPVRLYRSERHPAKFP